MIRAEDLKKAEESAMPVTLLSELSEYAFDDELPADLSERHDVYLYLTLHSIFDGN
jgi:hypothetical protein